MKSQTNIARQVDAILKAAEHRMAQYAEREHGNLRRLNLVTKRNHSKRHSENKERSFADRQKAENTKKKAIAYLMARQKFLTAAQHYWQGKGDHP